MRRSTLRGPYLGRIGWVAVFAASALVGCASGIPAAPSDPALQGGWRIYRDKNCGACHEIGGTGGHIGPPLSHVGTVAGTRRAGLSAAKYLRESITDPSAYVVPGYPDSMPHGLARDLSDQEIDDLVRYLASLR
ncbi:MAG: cytochrome c [Chloroflexota bacterium]|nr:cytochrome c [Chloroflexota bacterium]